MPHVDALLVVIGGVWVLSTIDLTKGYWQIPMVPTAREKTASATSSGLYHFVKMPFGLHGAPTLFQILMDKALNGVQDCAVPYIDDVLVFILNWAQHMHHLRWMFQALRQAKLTANWKKSHLGQWLVLFIWAIPDKVAILHHTTQPQTKKDLPSFLGLTGYYWQFVPHFATLASSLMDLLKGWS